MHPILFIGKNKQGHPILFTGKNKQGHAHLSKRGVPDCSPCRECTETQYSAENICNEMNCSEGMSGSQAHLPAQAVLMPLAL